MATVNLGSIKFKWKGTYAGGTAYTVDDVVSYNGSSYICILASTGNLPTNATYFEQMSQKGTDADLLSIASTAQGDIYYNNGGAIARLGAGTSGEFLKTQGAGANPVWASAGGGLQSVQAFTSSGSHTYTKPAGITKIKVYVTGAGGGGGGSASSYTRSSGSGGASGATAIKLIDATSITTVSVTVGAGGTGNSNGNTGQSGGTSSFGAYCSANGGLGGYSAGSYSGAPPLASATGGDLNLTGQGTNYSMENGNGAIVASNGGGSFWSGGGSGAYTAVGSAGKNGSGGGGGSGNSANNAGGSGGDGVVFVEEYK